MLSGITAHGLESLKIFGFRASGVRVSDWHDWYSPV